MTRLLAFGCALLLVELGCPAARAQLLGANDYWRFPSANVPAFFVATTGNDSNAGTLAAPFATLGKCQTAMQGSGTTKTCYIRAGTYTPASAGTACTSQGDALDLTSSDNGETWSYYPPDGYGTAIINGGAVANTGLGVGLCSSATNLTVNGLYFENFQIAGIQSSGSAPVIKNNAVKGITNTASQTYSIVMNCALGGQILNNEIVNSTGHGIAVYPTATGCADNLLIAYNYIQNVITAQIDNGGVYLEWTNGGIGGTFYPQTGVVVKYNYVADVYSGGGGVCYYWDDLTNNITFTGNICRRGGTNHYPAFYNHGGSSNVGGGNIVDLTGDSGQPQQGALYISGTMTGNTWTNGLVVANLTSGTGGGFNCNSGPCGTWTLGPNDYYNYGSSGALTTTGSIGNDSNPQTANPNFTCGWEYTLPSSSPVYSSPVNFPAQPSAWGTAGFWGPPGFTIPQTGTVPSPPHTC